MRHAVNSSAKPWFDSGRRRRSPFRRSKAWGKSVHRCRADRRRAAATLRDRRRAPALLGSFAQLLSVAVRRAADSVPLWRLPADPPALSAARLPRRRCAVCRGEVGLCRGRMGSARPGRRDALRRGAAARPRLADGRRRAGLARSRRRRAACSRAGGVPVRAQRPPQAARQSRRPARRARRHDRRDMAGADFASSRATGLRFDLQTPWWHLHEAARLAADFPDTQIILNHTGLPADRSAEGINGWKRAMARSPPVRTSP